MKNVCLLLASSLIVLSACKKDHSTATTGGPSTNAADYALISFSSYLNRSLIDSMRFSYDAATRLLTSYQDILFGGGVGQLTYYQLSYTNGKCARIDVTVGGSSTATYYTYHYNSDSVADTVAFYSSGDSAPAGLQTFAYDLAGELTDERSFVGNAILNHYVYTYDVLGDLSGSLDSTLVTDPAMVMTTKYSNYDDKVNPLQTVSGFPITNTLIPALGVGPASPHNCGTSIAAGVVAPGGEYVVDTVNFKYTYNVAGLPIQIVNGIDTFKLAYQQFN